MHMWQQNLILRMNRICPFFDVFESLQCVFSSNGEKNINPQKLKPMNIRGRWEDSWKRKILPLMDFCKVIRSFLPTDSETVHKIRSPI